MKLFLAEYVLGRILLHLGCALRGGKVRFHLAGIRRELGRLAAACLPAKRLTKPR